MSSTSMALDSGTVNCQMLRRAAKMAAGEHGEEAWYLMNLFQRTQPQELLRICHFTLAKFMELNYEYFDDGWPIASRLEPPIGQSSFCRSRLGRHRNQQTRRFHSRSPPPPPPRCSRQELTPTKNGPTELVTPKRRTPMPRFGWLKGKNILPSKPAVSTTPVNKPSATHQFAPSTIPRQVSSIATFDNTDISPDFFYPWDNSKRSPQRNQNSDFTLCRYIIDYMLETPALSTSEGIFRRPGNLSRSRQLYNCLKDSIASSYLCVPQPSPPRSPSLSDLEAKGAQARSPRRNDVYGILHRAQLYDVASVLLRCLSTAHPKTSASSLHLQAQMLNSAYALVPPKATDLFVQATQLQYHLKDRRPVYALNPSEDWVHLLCHGRQILAYRIIIQLLLPAPERHLLVKLVSLLHKIAANSAETRMSPAALARCLAVAVFGLPDDAEAMGHYIDTLTNLIELSEELETLPAAVYKQVRGFLKSKLGSSPARFAADRLTDAETECTASGTPLIVDRSAMKRSWDTCQVNVDIKRAEIIKQTNASSDFSNNKENSKPHLRSHFCLWPKTSPIEAAPTVAPAVEPFVKRTRAPSPFLSWKKQRPAVSSSGGPGKMGENGLTAKTDAVK